VASISKRGRYWRAQIVRRGYPPQYRTFDTRAEAEAWSRAMETEMDRDDRLALGRAANTVRLELALVSHMFDIARKEQCP
jgi:hypothetical protein